MSNTADKLRQGLEKKKAPRTSEEALIDDINDVSSLLVKRFLANVKAGGVELNDVTDLVRVISLASEINNWNVGGSEGTGAPPAISTGQLDVFERTLNVTKQTVDGKEENVIDLNEIEALTDDQIVALMQEREILHNQENEATF